MISSQLQSQKSIRISKPKITRNVHEADKPSRLARITRIREAVHVHKRRTGALGIGIPVHQEETEKFT